MIIGIDARTLQDREYTGVSEFSFQLISELLRIDRVNEYRLFYNSSQDLIGKIPEFNYPNVTVQKFDYPNKLLNYGMIMPFNRPKLDQLLGGVDLFFSPHINFLAVSDSTDLILTIHDLSFLRHPEFFSSRKNLWHKCLSVKKIARQAKQIITVSNSTKNDVVELLGVPPEKVTVIYSGVGSDIGRVQDSAKLSQVREEYGLNDNFLLYLGTIEPRKNLEALIEAFEILKKEKNHDDLQLVLAGGTGWKYGGIINKIESSEFKDSIKLLGYVKRGDKSALYSLARGFVYPSLYEGFGFPPLEASRCGLPVLVSYSSSLPEISGSDSVVVNPYDVNDIAEGLKTLLRTKIEPKENSFSWQKTAKEYLDIFNNNSNR